MFQCYARKCSWVQIQLNFANVIAFVIAVGLCEPSPIESLYYELLSREAHLSGPVNVRNLAKFSSPVDAQELFACAAASVSVLHSHYDV